MTQNAPGAIRNPVAEPPGAGQAIALAGGVLWLRMPLPMVLDHVNVYALDDGDSWTIVDTGFDSRKMREIWRAALAGPLQGKPVRRVLVTHHHPDHIGLAGWFQSEFGAELLTTRTAWLMARMLCLDVQELPSPETLQFWRSAGMDPALLEERARARPFNFADVVAPLPLGYKRIREGDGLRLGGRDWRVRIGHGHAPEHATLWSEDGELVIGGDQLLATISPNLGVYATEPEADPVADWLEACERLKGFANARQLVLPGHKLPFSGLALRLDQLIDNHHGALARLLQYLETPHTAAECFVPLFRRKIGSGEYGLALVEAMAHVNHLHQLGKLQRTRRDDGAWLWRQKSR
ncbi:MAG: MBL fold metallo-hydrolase [Paracoccaceae bacterium]